MRLGAQFLGAALLTSIGVAGAPAFAQDTALADTLRQVVMDNTAAYDREDLAAAVATIATKSPDYESTQKELAEQFAALEVKSELVSFQYIGHDDEFAVARAKVKTVGTPKTADFADNTVDMILVFHQDGGVWKLWTDEILGVELHP